MSHSPAVWCDRCKMIVPGAKPHVPGEMTAGYYIAPTWKKYMNPGEQIVCDDCMWSDPRYIADYGHVNGR